MLAPKPYSRPRAANPQEARALYEHKINKRYPFVAKGYDSEYDCDYRIYGKTVREDKLPVARAITCDTAFFFLNSQQTFRGCETYTFIHMVIDGPIEQFKALLFTEFASAYRYAIAHGCHINKKPDVRMSILDFLQADTEDVDMFVEAIDTSTHTVSIKGGHNGGMVRRGYNNGP
jgi:hypothetical protein